MCGIAGIVLPELGHDDRRRIAEAMNASLFHRGPDGGGVFVGGPAAIGMRRLAIVDIEHGNQPMIGRSGDVALVFNGEIYNAPEIRAELEAEGIAFDTRSDTEVILRLYERDPDDVEQRLEGMWAFAILDLPRGALVLSRDRFGIKPLFVMQSGPRLAFASELRAFEASSVRGRFDAALQLDPSAAHAMVAWGYVPNERTIFVGVSRVPPATRCSFDLASGARRDLRHWVPRPDREAEAVRSMDEAVDLVQRVFIQSIVQHLRSDVPVATFLSGGIDSSLVTMEAARASSGTLEAFAIGFEDPRYDESGAAARVAQRLGVRLHTVILTEQRAADLAVEAFASYDEPFGDSSSLATLALSKTCAGSFKVALGGDGGDEAFAGYRKHRIVDIRERVGRIPGARTVLGAALALLPAPADRSRRWADVLRKVRRVARALEPGDAAAYRALTQVDSLARAAPMMRAPGGAEVMERELEAWFDATGGSQLARTLTTDIANTLPNDLLTKVDRASMAHSLEVRVPFLDRRVFEIGLGLPRRYTLGTRGKDVLRELCSRSVSPEIARLPKHGFEVPIESWLRGPLASLCDRLFERRALDTDGLLSPEAFSDGAWRRLAHDRPQLLWHALALAAWSDTHSRSATHKEGFSATISS